MDVIINIKLMYASFHHQTMHKNFFRSSRREGYWSPCPSTQEEKKKKDKLVCYGLLRESRLSELVVFMPMEGSFLARPFTRKQLLHLCIPCCWPIGDPSAVHRAKLLLASRGRGGGWLIQSAAVCSYNKERDAQVGGRRHKRRQIDGQWTSMYIFAYLYVYISRRRR